MLHNLQTSFIIFNRTQWLTFQNNTNNTLSQKDILNLKIINDDLSIREITEIYLPLSRFLNLSICSNLKQQKIRKQFSNNSQIQQIPYIIGITGSVASGKSTTAKILKILLGKWSKYHTITLVTTDGFLYSNQILKEKKIMKKKGFPQSYNTSNLIDFIVQIKSGTQITKIPVYSHIKYDIVQNLNQIIYTPNILILEGLNILQTHQTHHCSSHCVCISNLIDFSIYIDAPEYLLKKWYIRRFLKFCNISTHKKDSYFYKYSKLSQDKLISIATSTWNQTNKLNLKKNILPSKKHAHLILHKNLHHSIDCILLKNNNNFL